MLGADVFVRNGVDGLELNFLGDLYAMLEGCTTSIPPQRWRLFLITVSSISYDLDGLEVAHRLG